MRSVIAVLLIIISILAFTFLAGGSHGHIMFRPWITEDWIFWGLIIIPSGIGIYILVKPLYGNYKK